MSFLTLLLVWGWFCFCFYFLAIFLVLRLIMPLTIPISTPPRDFTLMKWPRIYNWRKCFKGVNNTFTFAMWTWGEIFHWIDVYWASIITRQSIWPWTQKNKAKVFTTSWRRKTSELCCTTLKLLTQCIHKHGTEGEVANKGQAPGLRTVFKEEKMSGMKS